VTDIQEIAGLLEQIIAKGYVPASYWPAQSMLAPKDLGLEDHEGALSFSEPPDLMDQQRIQQGLPGVVATTYGLIDSTNTQLVQRGARASVDSHLYLAEFQYGGRGRRGRRWLSPYARNLSMSLGAATGRELSELGGLSLVVGLALAEALTNIGVDGLTLKWPNDILVDDQKLCGILLELVQRKAEVEFVAGIGVNVALTDDEIGEIDQPVTDLRRCGVTLSRSELVIGLIQHVRRFLLHFETEGFSPFISAFNTLHKFHDQTCSMVHGSSITSGKVLGVGTQGELILQTDAGEQRFYGGEVSLRPLS
jgi:BirA family biotin operon repressor/biotin-[acetyl-CoA-carboxylase] ligase